MTETKSATASEQITSEVTSWPAARRIEDQEDVRDVIAMLRINYDRVVVTKDLKTRSARLLAPGDRARDAELLRQVEGG